MVVKFPNCPDLVASHKNYIDMIKCEMSLGNEPKQTRAKECALNPGMLESPGNQISRPARIWVDDTLIVAVGVTAMNMVTTVIESIFVVLGNPNLKYRQYLLAMYEWPKLVVSEHQLALWLI